VTGELSTPTSAGVGLCAIRTPRAEVTALIPWWKKGWKRLRKKMEHVHLVRGTNADGAPIEEFFFSEELAEWECAAHEVDARPHEKTKLTLNDAVEQHGIYFKVMWVDPGGYHEEVWREFSSAEERHGGLLFELADYVDPLDPDGAVAEIHPLNPKEVDRNSVKDLH
jgi:hypothetical protein